MGLVTTHLIKGVAAGIGLASEGLAARKAKRTQKALDEDSNGSTTTTNITMESREILELDRHTTSTYDPIYELPTSDNHQNTPQNPPPNNEPVDETALVTQFASHYPIPVEPSLSEVVHRLPAPVLLPQRRPKNRDRGFLRAYAPDLAPCGIDQEMFIEFLNTAEKGCRAHRWLQAINLAAIAGHAVPSLLAIAVGVAIHQIANLSIAADGRRRANNFFNQANEEFFKPRGLYCLVMTWYPEDPDIPAMSMDLQSTIAKATFGADSTVLGSSSLGSLERKFKRSDGKTFGNVFSEVAPLVFPEPETLGNQLDPEEKFYKVKKKRDFIHGYLDKRAQATFEAENPNSHLNQRPKPTFASRFADPNHPASSGDLLALLSGGYISRSGPGERKAGDDSIIRTVISTGSKMFESKALYLAIVNLPSEDEMKQARSVLGI
ncbi:uncharacterized protein N7484_004887 [Penicillium longicatenatum]|uniref:uncharacterized protein n=1 Tax=Penicillium longicatenatum TaxID=1561947 RepID=UPI00254900B2|nr:uncharacterized protein N7484_004887 [Penicillium longicatenatum]KAJ5651164.1 hypothetical protein N7484_004887 [Penicillium longicatenatum]